MQKLWLLITLLAFPLVNGQQQPIFLSQEAEATAQPFNLTSSSGLARGLAYYRKGEYEQAIALWQSLLNDPQVKRDRLLLGQLWNYLSLAQQKLYQWNVATQSIRRSLGYLTPSPRRKHTELQQRSYAQALTTQGQLYLELGDDVAAIDTWSKSEQIYRYLGDDLGVRGSLMNQALALEQSGFYRRACFTILEAVQIESQCDLSDPDAVFAAFARQGDERFRAIALHTFSKILIQLGELDLSATALQKARFRTDLFPQLRRSLDLTAASLSFAQYQVLKQEESRARTRRLSQRLQDRVVQHALQTQQGYDNLIASPMISDQSDLMQYQARVDYLTFLIDYVPWLREKQREDTAMDTVLQQQLHQLQTHPSDAATHRTALYAHIKQAEALISLLEMDPVRYASLRGRAARLLQQVLQASTPSTFSSASVMSQTQAFAYGALGRLYEIQRQWSQAERATQLALSNSQTAQNADISYQWQWQLGRILAAQGQRDRAIQAYEQALVALQSVRQDLLLLKRDAQFSFRDQIEPSYRQLVSLLLSDATPNTQRLSQARRVIDRLQVSEVEDFLLQNCINASLASLDAYLERQAPNAALVYTIIQDEHLDVIVKIPRSNQIQFHRVNQSKAQLNATIKTYRRSITEKLPSAKRRSQEQGQQLYKWLIEPFQAEFQRSQIGTLVFVLDQELRDIPMATLYSGQRYLIEDYAIAVTPGLQVLEASQTLSPTPQALVAGASEGNQTLGLPALPAVKREIQQIQSALPKTEILLDDAFTTRSFQSSLQAGSSSIIHIATHGQFSSNPEETFIVTGRGERLDINALGRLLRQRTRAQSLELLFLSACQTLAGDRWAALGMAGMAIRSGAQSTIASIWNADDEASAELVSRFYAHLTAAGGRTKAEALRLAQIDMLKNPRYDLPVYWSPYVLIGNWQ